MHADNIRDGNLDWYVLIGVVTKEIICRFILQDIIWMDGRFPLSFVNFRKEGDARRSFSTNVLIKISVALAFCSRRNVLVEYNRVATRVEIEHVSEALRKFHIHKGSLKLVAETDSQKCRLNLLDFAESQYVVEYCIIRVFIAEVNIVAFK